VTADYKTLAQEELEYAKKNIFRDWNQAYSNRV
jgi:hypothetical protein